MASDRDTLPSSVKPIHYDLAVHTLELQEPFSFQGTVRIDLDIKESAKEITLNALQLQIHDAELTTSQNKSDQTFKFAGVDEDKANQRAIIKFADAFPASKATLIIKYQGTMNNVMAGFYRSKYKPVVEAAASVARDSEYHYMFSTQFESCDARRAFPCFDEPNLKATFDFAIEIPEDQTALSNMPEKNVGKGSKDGLKIVAFERTPIMSTYLLAWAFGDFEYVEAFTKRKYNGKNMPVRVYTTRGLKEQGQWALDHAHQTVDYFSEIFDIDYPLPKSDLLAVHEFSHGAMENWGLVTYRTTAVLFDEKSSDPRYKNRVAYVVAHELAHQWFGNLVTMDWWNELWLNEGFATWVGWLAVDHLHPEWKVWPQFVCEGLQTAQGLDAIRNSHAIEVPVRNALEVDQIFDAISYLKGSSVIRMLSSHLGNETFLKGVSNYLKKHQYSNAKTSDLWSALSEASGQDINKFMGPWINKIGFPVVTLAEEPGQIGAKQSRFLITGDVKPEDDETTWWIPLGLKTGSASAASKSVALSSKEETIRDVDEAFYKINADQTGFYRTNYPPERLRKLAEARQQLSDEDKIGLIGDAAALAQSGDGTTAAFLSFIEQLRDEKENIIWQQMLMSLNNVRSVFSDNAEVSKGLGAFALKLVSPAAEKIGWDAAPNEDLLTGQLRGLLLLNAGLAGHEAIVAEAKQKFSKYIKGDESAIHPSLRTTVFRIAINAGGKEEYEAVKQSYKTTSSVDGKEIALLAMGRVQTADLAKDFLDFTFSSAVAVQDKHSPAAALAQNNKTRGLLWSYIKENWDSKVHPQLSGNSVVLERFLRMSLNKFASFEVQKDIKGFFEGKDQRGYDRGLKVIENTIEGAARYAERDAALLKEWLGSHGYL